MVDKKCKLCLYGGSSLKSFESDFVNCLLRVHIQFEYFSKREIFSLVDDIATLSFPTIFQNGEPKLYITDEEIYNHYLLHTDDLKDWRGYVHVNEFKKRVNNIVKEGYCKQQDNKKR